jgi:hypothetical protein
MAGSLQRHGLGVEGTREQHRAIERDERLAILSDRRKGLCSSTGGI